MDSPTRHIWLHGGRAADRAAELECAGAADIAANCHRGLRGPYSGTCVVLKSIAAQAYNAWPDLVDDHRTCILYAAPALSEVIGPAPSILTFSTPHDERTRFFGLGYVRSVSHGIVTFLTRYAERLLANCELAGGERTRPLTIFFDNVHAADPTEQEFLQLLLRRAAPETLRVVVGSADDGLPGGLTAALTSHAVCVEVATSALAPLTSSDEDLAREYIGSDGTTEDPRLYAAYQRVDSSLRALLHDQRATELEATGDWDLRLGALPYHREHGRDRAGAGCQALRAALEHCLAMGYYAALYDFGMRGRTVVDIVTQQREYCHFTAKAASALVALGNPAGAERLFLELRELYALPAVHMSTSYNLAMLYTRWYDKKDHDLAKCYCNNAIALAVNEPDALARAFYTVFQRNGLALVEMHRGNLELALDLVTSGLARLNTELPEDKYIVHREQLLHNRARVLVAMGRLDDAISDFSKLLAKDPYFTEYYIDRGNAARRLGDDVAAFADYDKACGLGIPFPEVYYNRGDIRAAQGDIAGAIVDFGYVLELEPDYLDARISHAELLIDADELDLAAASVAEGLALYPDNAALHALDGLIALLAGEAQRAGASLDRAIALDPQMAAAHAHRGVLAADGGDDQLAVTHLTSALALLGDEPELRYRRALSLLSLGQLDEAERDLRVVIEVADDALGADARARLALLSF